MKAAILAASLMPFADSTPLDTSTPQGRTRRTAAATFSRVATHSAMLLLEPPTREAGARSGQMAQFEAAFGTGIDPALWKANNPFELAGAPPAGLPALSFDCGSEDRYGFARGHEKFHELLVNKGVAHEWGLHPGNHGYEYVHTVFDAGLRFLTKGW